MLQNHILLNQTQKTTYLNTKNPNPFTGQYMFVLLIWGLVSSNFFFTKTICQRDSVKKCLITADSLQNQSR